MNRHTFNIGTRATAIIAGAMMAMSASAASSVTVQASADSTVMLMGDLNHLRVTVDMPASSHAELIDFPILPTGTEYIDYKGVDVVASDSSSVIADSRRRIQFDFTIQAFDPGTVTLPPFAVLEAPGADTAFSNVVTFKVLPVDVDSLQTINPLAPIASANSRWYDYIPNWIFWALGAILVLAGALIAFRFLRKHKEEIFEQKKVRIPPYDLAKMRLSKLKDRHLPENGHEKEYYTELVDILREYLQGRFGIFAMEMTSSQIIRALRSNPETRLSAPQMQEVLAIADFVKFAKVRPLPDDNIKSYARAMEFVDSTKPAPEPENPEQPENGAPAADKSKNVKK